METIRLFLNTILIFNIIITVYYFNDLENYCKTENKLCINDPKRELLAVEISKIAKEKGISKIYLDRGPNIYHGIIKAFADEARSSGMSF